MTISLSKAEETASELFGSPRGNEWLHAPHDLLCGQTPADAYIENPGKFYNLVHTIVMLNSAENDY